MGSDDGNPNGASDSGAGDGVLIQIRCSNGSKFTVRAGLGITVGEFKTFVAQNCDVPANRQRLIYKGSILKDDQTLESYGLEEEHTVHMVRSFVPDASANASSAASPSPAGPDTTAGVARVVGSNEGGGFGVGLGASLFPRLGGSGLSDLFVSGLPQSEQVQQQTQNPNLVNETMNMSSIHNLINNPELIHNFLMSNPHIREGIDQNPQLAHILNNPSTLQQTMEIARNPELMREMIRNTDRALSNIESHPEGFNMLRRMYENVQEPLLNATSMAEDTGNVLASNPFAALLGGQGGGQVQHQSTTPSTVSNGTTEPSAPNTNPLPNPWSQADANGGAQTNTSRRPNSARGSPAPDTDDLFNTPSLDQFLQNPAMPRMMQQMLGLTPELRSVLDSNSQLTELMQNPEFQLQLTSPEALQQLMALLQSVVSPVDQPEPAQGLGQSGGGTGNPNNMGLDLLMNMFGGLGSGSFTVPNTSNVPPEQLYATQLSQLQEMGFIDTLENIRALRATSGNVHTAIERLLGNPGG